MVLPLRKDAERMCTNLENDFTRDIMKNNNKKTSSILIAKYVHVCLRLTDKRPSVHFLSRMNSLLLLQIVRRCDEVLLFKRVSC